MSRALAVRAEVLKLARLVGRDPESLDYLGEVPPAEVRELREQITDVLFTSVDGTLGRLAAASRLLPVGVVATIGEHAFGPVLSARIAGMLDPDRAMEMAGRLPVAFLAEIAVSIDPRRASDVIARIPAGQIAEITAELARRDEYVTMGRIVGLLPDDSLEAALEVLDDEALLQVAFVLESKDGLDELVSRLPRERLDGILDAAATANLWAEALDLLGNLGPDQRREFAQRAGTRDAAVLESLIVAARDLEMWSSLLPLIKYLQPEGQERVAGNVERLGLTRSERERVLEHARAQGVLDEIGPLAAVLSRKH